MSDMYNFSTASLPDFQYYEEKNRVDVPTEAIRDMGANGEIPPDTIVLDGRIHRFGRDNVCWYVGHDGKYPILIWANWSKDEKHEVRGFGELSPEEEMEMKAVSARLAAERRAIEEQIHKEKAEEAQKMWDLCSEMEELHPYFVKKGIEHPKGLYRIARDKLVIRVLSPEGNLQSIQLIEPDGTKKCLPGGKMKGGYGMIPGSLSIYLCEGMATAESIHAATKGTVYYSFSAGNLKAVYGMLVSRHLMPILVADNDESGTGENYAKECTRDYVLIPVKGMDANDYAVRYGITALGAILEPPLPFVTATEFVRDIISMPYLIKGFLYQQTFSCFFGESGKGKTMALVDIACSVACEDISEWSDRKMKHGTVVMFEGEGMQGLRLRVKAWMMAHHLDHLDSLVIYNGPPKGLDSEGDLAYVKTVLRRLAETGRDIVWTIFDTYNRFFHGDENSAQEVGSFVRGCTELINELGLSISIVHHTGVSELAKDRGRGSSALRAGEDTEYKVAQDDAGMVSIECTKMKDGESPETIYGRIQGFAFDIRDEDGEPIKSAYFSLLTSEEREAERQRIREEEEETKSTMTAVKAFGRFVEMFGKLGHQKNTDGSYRVERQEVVDYLSREMDISRSNARDFFNKRDTTGNHFIADLIEAGILLPSRTEKVNGNDTVTEWTVVADYRWTQPLSRCLGGGVRYVR